MRLIAKAIRIWHAKFHCNRLTTVQDIQDYVIESHFLCHSVLHSLLLTTSTDSRRDVFGPPCVRITLITMFVSVLPL